MESPVDWDCRRTGHGALQLLRGQRGVGLLAKSLLAQEKCSGVLHMSHLCPCTPKHIQSFTIIIYLSFTNRNVQSFMSVRHHSLTVSLCIWSYSTVALYKFVCYFYLLLLEGKYSEIAVPDAETHSLSSQEFTSTREMQWHASHHSLLLPFLLLPVLLLLQLLIILLLLL